VIPLLRSTFPNGGEGSLRYRSLPAISPNLKINFRDALFEFRCPEPSAPRTRIANLGSRGRGEDAVCLLGNESRESRGKLW